MIRQPNRKGVGKKTKSRKTPVKRKSPLVSRPHKQQYGVSKLEMYFAHNYLDILKLDYVYEYEAKDIGRFYDFAIVATPPNVELITEEKNGIISLSQNKNILRPIILVEVDGDYWHSNPDVVDENKLTPKQKHNKFVDKIKDEWCEKHKIPLLRIWESDIRNNSKKVFKMINDEVDKLNKLDQIKLNKNKPHGNSGKRKTK